MARDRAGGALVVNLNEKELAQEIEALEERQGHLTGQLALRNATVTIELPDESTWRTGLEDRFDELLRLASGP